MKVEQVGRAPVSAGSDQQDQDQQSPFSPFKTCFLAVTVLPENSLTGQNFPGQNAFFLPSSKRP
jgi:hypothetical protein